MNALLWDPFFLFLFVNPLPLGNFGVYLRKFIIFDLRKSLGKVYHHQRITLLPHSWDICFEYRMDEPHLSAHAQRTSVLFQHINPIVPSDR